MSQPDCSESLFLERDLLYLRAGDGEGHRRLCEQMWDLLSKRPDVISLNDVVWVCVRVPGSPIPPDRMVTLLEQTLPSTPAQSRRNRLHTLGAALYRAGRFPEALARLEESLRLEEKSGNVEDWVFLALVHRRLDHHDKAREYVSRADKEMEQVRASKSRPGTAPLPWRDLTEMDLLYKEAKAILTE
jgi:tetratricopeptide (TPR) repeat protein